MLPVVVDPARIDQDGVGVEEALAHVDLLLESGENIHVNEEKFWPADSARKTGVFGPASLSWTVYFGVHLLIKLFSGASDRCCPFW